MSNLEDELKKEVEKGIVPEDVAYAMRSHAKQCLQAVVDEVEEQLDATLSCKKDVINQYEAGYWDGQQSAWEQIIKILNKHLSNE